MKKQLVVSALVLSAAVLFAPPSFAGRVRRCSIAHFGHLKFRVCQSEWRPPRHDYWRWRRRHWRRHHCVRWVDDWGFMHHRCFRRRIGWGY
jgi:hypothetical protein